MPEQLAKVPKVTADRSGTVTSRGVHTMLDGATEVIYNKLRDGVPGRTLDGIAPKVTCGSCVAIGSSCR